MKDKRKYQEDNPNHILIKKGEQFIDFNKYENLISNFDKLERKEQFGIRRTVLAKENRLDKKVEFKKIRTNDFNDFSIKDKKIATNKLKDTILNSFNAKLKSLGYEEKYLSNLEANALGLKKQIKHNIRGNREIDEFAKK